MSGYSLSIEPNKAASDARLISILESDTAYGPQIAQLEGWLVDATRQFGEQTALLEREDGEPKTIAFWSESGKNFADIINAVRSRAGICGHQVDIPNFEAVGREV